jgi:hypothetical protein
VKGHIASKGDECVDRREARVGEAETEGNKEKNEDVDFIKELLDLHDKCKNLTDFSFVKMKHR